MTPTRTIFFWSPPGLDEARRRRDEERRAGRKATTRDAMVFDGVDLEPCDVAVVLDSVRPGDLQRIAAAYKGRGTEVLVERPRGTVSAEVLAANRDRVPLTLAEKLRRMTNKRLRSYAHDNDVDISQARDRATIIAAIEAAAQAQGPPK